ncbi:Pro-Pol polyprotein [Stylophora pistillata]|uniref:Pro-Pol polyprotein n=1 Tax=Stylophora pistillata TaxID=50429 RepID=A0A2B4RUK4_STYPI|nr:Pro-Pol polyprotein [Stylophora pistillata]
MYWSLIWPETLFTLCHTCTFCLVIVRTTKSREKAPAAQVHDVPDGEIDPLSGIANNLKLDQKKAPAINEQIAKIVHGLLREKLTDKVLTATQNRYNTPENYECLTSTKVNHLIWDKLKPDTRCADIKLQRVQSNLVKGLIPVVSMAEKLVQAQDKIPKEALDAPDLIRAATDAIALIGAANFQLNMQCRENIKPMQKEDYKHMSSSSVPFTDFSFGNDADLSKQLKDLVEATKVSKKLNPKGEGHKSNGYRGVFVESPHSQGEIVSSIFLRLKKNGVDYRMILNLKELNQFIVYWHFKMDSLKTVTELMTQGCFMASVDIRDPYYTVPIAIEHQKYLKFMWRDKLYQHTCLPNGLASAPRIFTKLLKPVFNVLREIGYLSSSYIDDGHLQGASYRECYENVLETVMLLRKLGFSIHKEKSVLVSSQVLTCLGFVLNSIMMTVQLTDSQKEKLKNACLSLVNKENCTVQQVAEVMGLLVSGLPGVELDPLHYRSLERDKSNALRENKGNFGSSMTLSPSSRAELNWWITNANTSHKLISHGEPELLIQTDASTNGWGGPDWEMPGKNSSKQSRGNTGGALLDMPKLVSQTDVTTCGSSTDHHIQGNTPNTTRVPETSPTEEKVESVSMSFMRRLYKNRGFFERATNILLQSWSQSSQKQYDAHIRKWLFFYTRRQADPICPTISLAVEFLTTLYDEGLS